MMVGRSWASMNSVTVITTEMQCKHCGESLDISQHFYGYSGESSFFLSCSAVCYIERGVDDDDTAEEITFEQYQKLSSW